MRKKLIWTITFSAVMICFFILSASAEAFNVTYYNGGTKKDTVTTDENGAITLKDTCYSNDTATKSFLGWFTYEGDMYKPGEQITIDKDIELYQFFGLKVDQKTFVSTEGQWAWTYIQLQEDIVLENTISINDGGRLYIDLNGHSITSTASNAFYGARDGLVLVGEGSIIHKGTSALFRSNYHFYSPNNVCLYIGKNVRVSTQGTLYSWNLIQNHLSVVIPFEVYGAVSCNQLLQIDQSIDDSMGIVLNPKSLIVTGERLFSLGTYPTTAFIDVKIQGGSFNFSSSASTSTFWNSDNPTAFTISITDGAINTDSQIISSYIPSTHTATGLTVDGKTYTYVSEGSECAHSYSQISTEKATCILYAKSNQKCALCGDTISVICGDLYDHSWTLVEEIPATPTEPGVRTYDCDTCDKIKEAMFYYDPNDLIINVGTTSGVVQALVSDVLNLVKSEDEYEGVTYTIEGVNAFDDYELADIISIEIPAGVTNANFTLKNEYLQKITILDNANIKITKFTNLTALKTIEIKDATVRFVNGCSNDALTTIDSSTSGANVIFEANVFADKLQLTELTLSTGSEYEFGSSSFKHSRIKELIIPDGCTPVFKSEGAFYENEIEYIYIGKGNKTISGKPFDRSMKLKTLVLMDVEALSGEWNFCVLNEVETLLEVYIHSEKISLPKNTFYMRSGIVVYTTAEITNADAFSSCSSYTIIKGIPHKLIQGTAEPTCTEAGVNGYITDCPCSKGLIGEVEVKIFNTALTNSQSFTTETYTSYEVKATGHTEGEIYNIEYLNGFGSKGTKTASCLTCSEIYTEAEPTAVAIFEYLGYSSNKDFTEFAIGYMFDVEAMEIYESISGKAFAYGFVGAITQALDGKAPHEVNSSAVALIEFERGTSYIVYRLKGFTENLYSLGITMSAFAKVTDGDTTEYYYIQDEQTQNPKSYTLAEYIASLPLEETA